MYPYPTFPYMVFPLFRVQERPRPIQPVHAWCAIHSTQAWPSRWSASTRAHLPLHCIFLFVTNLHPLSCRLPGLWQSTHTHPPQQEANNLLVGGDLSDNKRTFKPRFSSSKHVCVPSKEVHTRALVPSDAARGAKLRPTTEGETPPRSTTCMLKRCGVPAPAGHHQSLAPSSPVLGPLITSTWLPHHPRPGHQPGTGG